MTFLSKIGKDKFSSVRKIFAQIPQADTIIKTALESNGFKNTGETKSYYFIDEYYVYMMSYKYP